MTDLGWQEVALRCGESLTNVAACYGLKRTTLTMRRQRAGLPSLSHRQAHRCKGATHPAWKGGRFLTGEGYVRLLTPHHPNADHQGYMLEHRLVVEKDLGRFLTADEVVHHINGVKDDNRIENLQLFESQDAHTAFHKLLGW
jgi:hypothetical protein